MDEHKWLIIAKLYEFTTKEQGSLSERCIWCKQKSKKNAAHIISKRLLKTDHKSNILYSSVCEQCNSYIGSNVEDWLLKYTFLPHLSNQYFKRKSYSFLRFNPTYKYFPGVNEWLVHDGGSADGLSGYTLFDQVIFFQKRELWFLVKADHDYETLYSRILQYCTNSFSPYISKAYPEDFSPRIILHRNKITVTGRTIEDVEALKHRLKDEITEALNQNSWKKTYLDEVMSKESLDWKARTHLKWSLGKWLKCVAKVSYEFLSLFEGVDFVLNEKFEPLRRFLFAEDKMGWNFEVIMGDNSNAKDYRFSPYGWITIPEEAFVVFKTRPIPALYTDLKEGDHNICIYEVNGWVCCTTTLFGIDMAQLVLAGPELTLNSKMYLIKYDCAKNTLRFYKSYYGEDTDIYQAYLYGSKAQLQDYVFKLSQKELPDN